MSDFLSRLVQRTRGEAATLRPRWHALTAPDPGGAAWDEQTAVREAPLLARSPHAAPPPAHAGPLANVDLAPLPPGNREQPAAPMTAQQLDRQRVAARELEPEPVRLRARGVPPDAAATLSVAEHECDGSRDDAHAGIASVTTKRVQPMPTRPIAAPLAVTPARTDHDAVDLLSAREPSTSGVAPRSAAALSAPVAADGRAWGTAPTSPAAISLAAPRAEARAQGARGRAAREFDALQQHSTTVEVSIGRIEIRQPPRPRTTADDAPSQAPRRATVGLAAYLNDRDAGGKSR